MTEFPVLRNLPSHLLLWMGMACAVAWYAAPSAGLAADDPQRVTILISPKGSYRMAASAITARLTVSGIECNQIEVPPDNSHQNQTILKSLSESHPALIITGGSSLTTEVLESIPKVPVVFMLVPNTLDAAFLSENSPHRARIAGVSSDVVPAEQIEWIRKTAPLSKRIAVLCSPRTQRTAAALKLAARKAGLEITPVPTEREKFPDAIDALNQGEYDGVVMIPDSKVYNRPNVERLLLWGSRQKHPVWSFSDNIVLSGAFAGIYSDPEQIGEQTSELVRRILKGEEPRKIGLQYPRAYGRAVNLHTAEMIDLKLDHQVLSAQVVKYGDKP